MSHHQDALEHDLAELFGEARRMMTPDGDPALAGALQEATRRRRRRSITQVAGVSALALTIVAGIGAMATLQGSGSQPTRSSSPAVLTAAGSPSVSPLGPGKTRKPVSAIPVHAASQSLISLLPDLAARQPGIALIDPLLGPEMATVMGYQVCDEQAMASFGGSPPVTAEPVAGLIQQGFVGDGRTHDTYSVDIAITRYDPAAVGQAWRNVTENTGACRWVDNGQSFEQQPWAGREGLRLIRPGQHFGLSTTAAVQRVDDYIVSVSVAMPSAASAWSEAQNVSELIAAKIRAAG